jgi:hypothetical protein
VIPHSQVVSFELHYITVLVAAAHPYVTFRGEARRDFVTAISFNKWDLSAGVLFWLGVLSWILHRGVCRSHSWQIRASICVQTFIMDLVQTRLHWFQGVFDIAGFYHVFNSSLRWLQYRVCCYKLKSPLLIDGIMTTTKIIWRFHLKFYGLLHPAYRILVVCVIFVCIVRQSSSDLQTSVLEFDKLRNCPIHFIPWIRVTWVPSGVRVLLLARPYLSQWVFVA